MDEKLTKGQAFEAMTEFLKQHFRRTKSDDLAALLGDMRLVGDGETADPAIWSDWEKCVELASQPKARD